MRNEPRTTGFRVAITERDDGGGGISIRKKTMRRIEGSSRKQKRWRAVAGCRETEEDPRMIKMTRTERAGGEVTGAL